MAQRVVLIDDFDGTERGVVTVPFSFDGQNFEIDLNKSNRERMRAALEPFMALARHLQPRPTSAPKAKPKDTMPRARSSSANTARNARIRAWANDNGFELGERGRISKEVLAEYNRSTSKAKYVTVAQTGAAQGESGLINHDGMDAASL